MVKSTPIILCICTIVTFSLHCKKSQNVSDTFVIALSNRVKVMDGTDVNSRQLPSPEKYDMLKVLGVEKGKYLSYWKVKCGNEEGYLEHGEYGIDVFTTLQENSLAMVNTASLRVRQAPAIDNDSKVLFSVNKGDIIKVLARGKQTMGIEGRFNVWYQVESKDGKKGFCFGNYITLGSEESLKALRNAKIEPCSGWIRVTGEPRFTSSPGRDAPAVTENDPAKCNHDLSRYPKKGEFAPVAEKATIGSELFYRVEDAFMDFLECSGSINGWISAQQAEYFTDFFAYTKEKCGSRYDAAMLAMLNTQIGGNLNVSSLKMEPVTLTSGGAGTQYYLAKVFKGPRKPNHAFFLAKNGTSYTTLLYIPGGGHERNPEWEPEPKLIDLDKDGTKEIFVAYPGVDEEYRYSLFALGNNTFREVIDINMMGNRSHFIRNSFLVFFPEKITDKSFLKKAPFSNEYEGKKTRVLKYSKGSLSEVDSASAGMDFGKLQDSDELIILE